MKKNTVLLVLIVLAVAGFDSAYCQLTVKSGSYGSKPGYIDNATLIVEPHGAYVEQSLYLSYADHYQYPSSQIEIVHRFELPANAVVNDMWLWIGDSVMQARILDTWTARAIYDSIVSTKRDPAFLSKNGTKYELHVYPLLSGGFRKIKLNFITPTRWFGTSGTAELPLKLLKDNNALKKPVSVIFREASPIWGTPLLQELPLQPFTALKDSNGYRYTHTTVSDISSLSTFTLGFTTQFTDGFFITSSDVKNDGTFFQFGFNPGALFGLSVDPLPRNLLFALDLSGVHNKNFTTLIPRLKELIQAAAKPNDSIAVMVAGAGTIEMLTPVLRPANADTIATILDRFAASTWGAQVAQEKLKHVLYADAYASTCWQYPGLEQLATYKNYTTLTDALKDKQGADIIAAYRHGYEDVGNTTSNYASIITQLDNFFAGGGRFLTYYDFNRVGREMVGTHYVPGLTVTRRPDGSKTLYRNPNGNIGIYFPESFVHYGFDYLQYSQDPSIKIEVQDKDGMPVVISKKIGNGLIVISGIWSFRDDGALRSQLGTPLLGLNAVSKNQQLTPLLAAVQAHHKLSPIEKVFVVSNADSLFHKVDAFSWASSYIDGFGTKLPKISTVNLLDGSGFTPPYITDELVQYYGSGFLLKTLAAASAGRHFETHIDDWPYIVTSLNAYSYPVADSLKVTVAVDNGAGQLKEMREVNPLPLDANKSRFFIGSTSMSNKIEFNVRARFSGAANGLTSSTVYYVVRDTSKMDTVLAAMLAKEKLNDLFNQQTKDTSRIVQLAMRYRLLCDFTALLALEPNDTIRFMKNPFDESVMDVEQLIDDSMADSMTVRSYPNPFNNQTSIVVTVRRQSFVDVGIYNMLGQLVKELASNELVAGAKTYTWNGTDGSGRGAASGAYFIRMVAKEKNGGSQVARLRKIVYLK